MQNDAIRELSTEEEVEEVGDSKNGGRFGKVDIVSEDLVVVFNFDAHEG